MTGAAPGTLVVRDGFPRARGTSAGGHERALEGLAAMLLPAGWLWVAGPWRKASEPVCRGDGRRPLHDPDAQGRVIFTLIKKSEH